MYKELYSIFYLNGFKENKINKEEFEYIDEIMFFMPIESLKKQEYFIVINLKKPTEEELENLLDEDFNKIYTEIASKSYFNNYISKNTTAIIFMELEDLNNASDNSSLNKKILNIEESKYNFKKNIITYTQKQLREFQEIYKTEDDIRESINKVIYDKKKFIDFKRNPSSDSIYNFMSKLQIKIPFLTLKSEEKELISLKENIDKRLVDLNYDKLINKIINVENFEEIDMERFIEEI
ncbi:MAG: ABC-three component system middle component 1 [Clostridium sp.]